MEFVTWAHLSGVLHKYLRVHQSVYLYVYSLIVAGQQFGENIIAEMHLHKTTEELFYA
jgi:hypothetical protein